MVNVYIERYQGGFLEVEELSKGLTLISVTVF